ncbi:MAG: acetyl-CoA C-acyltransferase [Deltaproteobacteria bacterium]|nr:MAG: acetyl-CoA C-acyltransferase [Deltaproteobacteria bacterium]
MQDAVIVASARTPVGKAFKGALATTRPDELAALTIKGVLERVPNLDPADIDDVIIGCSFPEAEQGLNFARLAAILAGLPDSVPGQTVNRFCSSGLQSIAMAAQSIMTGMSEVIVAGGAESMTRVPMTGNKIMVSNDLVDLNPDATVGMGLTAENVAELYNVSREDQDAFAAESHRRALAAQESGRFDGELILVEVKLRAPAKNGTQKVTSFIHGKDEGPRPGTSVESLAKLKPVFRAGGSVTAGNSSQMSDGAAATVVMSARKAKELGLKPLARFVSFAVGGVDPKLMGIGPIVAIPKALKLAGLKKEDIGLIELNEAFASQALAVIRELGLDPEIINVNGGAIALGHPLGCTGSKLTATLLNEMGKRDLRYGMVSMCIGGGMGAAGIYEKLT